MSLDENYKNFELILNSEITETKEQRCNVHVYNSNFYYPLTEVLSVSCTLHMQIIIMVLSQ